jgi:hypothetical protein
MHGKATLRYLLYVDWIFSVGKLETPWNWHKPGPLLLAEEVDYLGILKRQRAPRKTVGKMAVPKVGPQSVQGNNLTMLKHCLRSTIWFLDLEMAKEKGLVSNPSPSKRTYPNPLPLPYPPGLAQPTSGSEAEQKLFAGISWAKWGICWPEKTWFFPLNFSIQAVLLQKLKQQPNDKILMICVDRTHGIRCKTPQLFTKFEKQSTFDSFGGFHFHGDPQ